jgi:hypothetical protein
VSPRKKCIQVEGAPLTNQPQPLIQLRQACKAYEATVGDFPALRGISTDISPGVFPGVPMTGVVESISGAAQIQGGYVLYTVHVR